MSETGTTRGLVRDIRRLIRNAGREARQQTDPKNERQPITSQRGYSEERPTGEQGIASPLTETDAGTRTTHPVHELTSTDGLIIMEVNPVATLEMIDANGEPVDLEFDDPYA